MPLDADPLFIRNPKPDMTWDDPLFVMNPKYAVPRDGDVLKTRNTFYDETVGPQPMNPPIQQPLTYIDGTPIVGADPLLQQTMMMADWMTYLPDEAPIGSMSIPGTHNSLSRHGGPSVQHQSWDIPAQLRGGIRYFDLKLRLVGSELVFYSGPQVAPTSLHEFMSVIAKFLTEHPREIILAKISNEAGGQMGSTDFYYQLHKTLNERYANFVFPLQIPNVRLGMARGKMVIVKDYSGGPPGGVEYNKMEKVEETTLPSPDAKNAKAMMKPIKYHLKKAMRCGDFEKMFVAVTSATGPGFPYQYAAVINERILFFLQKNMKGRIGIVVMDFPAELTIHAVIQRNFKQSK